MLKSKKSLEELRKIAEKNSEKRFPGHSRYNTFNPDSVIRRFFANQLRIVRESDRTGAWVEWGKANITTANKFFKLNLVKEITRVQLSNSLIRKKPLIVEISSGDGKLISDLANHLANKFEIHATGPARLGVWKTHLNSKNINWHVSVAENLNRVFKPKSISFIISHFGLTHAFEKEAAIQKACDLLVPGGRIIFNTQENSAGLKPPVGFFEVRKPLASSNENGCAGVVYYWERKR